MDVVRTQADPLSTVGSRSAAGELHKGSLICVRGYAFCMLVLCGRWFQMLKLNFLHTTNARAVLVKHFQECSNVYVVFQTCHNLLEKLQEVMLRFFCMDASGDGALKLKAIHQSSKSLTMSFAMKR